MLSLAKSALLSVSLLTGVAFAAHAQSDSVAALPPNAATPPAASGSVGFPGPNPGSGYYGGTVAQQAPVVPSPQYIGPNPGAGTGQLPPKFQKSADYDQNPALHPYTSSGMGPRPH